MSSVEEVKKICKKENPNQKSPITKLCKRLKGKKITENTSIDERFYSPLKYFLGLNDKEINKRIEEINISRKKEPKSYKPFSTDIGKKTKQSKYTKLFYELYPNAVSLEDKAKVTGVPLDILKKVKAKGNAAWTSGHRPGASQESWAIARIHSFLMRGCTFYGSDRSLAVEARTRSKKADQWWKKIKCNCEKGCN
jgi:hypothetical protein